MQKICLRLIYDRKSTGDAARALLISKSTVESHLAQARRTLGVTRSIEAALLLHDFEQREPPCKPSTDSARLLPSDHAAPSTSGRDASPWWRALIPIRRAGQIHNDQRISQRILAALVVAFLAAIGFGSFASGVAVIDALVARFEHRQ